MSARENFMLEFRVELNNQDIPFEDHKLYRYHKAVRTIVAGLIEKRGIMYLPFIHEWLGRSPAYVRSIINSGY